MAGVPETTTNITNKNRLENEINKEGFEYGRIPEIITITKKLRRNGIMA